MWNAEVLENYPQSTWMDAKIIYTASLQYKCEHRHSQKMLNIGTAKKMQSKEAIAGTATKHFLPVNEALQNFLVLGDNALIIFAKPAIAVLRNVVIDRIPQWGGDDQQGTQDRVRRRQVRCNFQRSWNRNMNMLALYH